VEERKRFGIEPRSVFSGVFVQVGVNATSAGVLVTKNLYDPRDNHTYTINAKRGLGLSVVSGTTVPEQVLYNIKYPGARVLSRSDDATMLVFDAQGGIKEVPAASAAPVLSEARARALSLAAAKLVKVFPDSGPLDIEWVLEGEKGELSLGRRLSDKGRRFPHPAPWSSWGGHRRRRTPHLRPSS
jgi:phosphoenolpyruvate synthase/pyruvate phosphate dikinase